MNTEKLLWLIVLVNTAMILALTFTVTNYPKLCTGTLHVYGNIVTFDRGNQPILFFEECNPN